MRKYLYWALAAVFLLMAAAPVYASDADQMRKDIAALTAEIAQLRAQIKQLDVKFDEIMTALAPTMEQGAAKNRQEKMRSLYQERIKRDQQTFTAEQLKEVEDMYMVGHENWESNDPTKKAALKATLEALVRKYPKCNRAGCALLYLAQKTDKSDEKETLLKQAFAEHADSMYGDGVQVGAYARYLLAERCRAAGQIAEAERLEKEIKDKYPDAINHSGYLLFKPAAK